MSALPDIDDYPEEISKDSDFASFKHLSNEQRAYFKSMMRIVLDNQKKHTDKLKEINNQADRENRIIRFVEIGVLIAIAVGLVLVAKAINNFNPPLPIANSKADDEIMAAMIEKMDRPNPELIKLQEQIKALQAKKSDPIVVTRTVYLSPKPKHTRVKAKSQKVKQPKKAKPPVKAEAKGALIDPVVQVKPLPKKPVIDINDAGMPEIKQ